MATSYSGTNAKPTLPLSLVDDGEVINHASLWKSAVAATGVIAKIMDWCAYLTTRVEQNFGAAGTPKSVVTFGNPTSAVAAWSEQTGYYQNEAAAAATLGIVIDDALPDGVTLTGIEVTIDPAGAHGGLPATMPQITLVKRTHTSGATASSSAGVDASGDVPTYEAVHQISLTGLTEAIDKSLYSYKVNLEGEGGGNAVALCRYYSTKLTFSPQA